MTDSAGGADEEAFADLTHQLAESAERVVPDWILRCVRSRLADPRDTSLDDAAHEAGRRAAAEVGSGLRDLAQTDIDRHATTPLSILRNAARHATALLAEAGVAAAARDPVDVARDPDDAYDLAPATFADVDESLAGPGIAWGAAKAHLHMRRHRSGTASSRTGPAGPGGVRD